MAVGSTKTRKYASRFPLFFIEGLKTCCDPLVLASSFAFFRLGASDRPSMFRLFLRGFHLGLIRIRISLVALQHLMGSGHPSVLSWVHGVHGQFGRFWWKSYGSNVWVRFESWTRSPVV